MAVQVERGRDWQTVQPVKSLCRLEELLHQLGLHPQLRRRLAPDTRRMLARPFQTLADHTSSTLKILSGIRIRRLPLEHLGNSPPPRTRVASIWYQRTSCLIPLRGLQETSPQYMCTRMEALSREASPTLKVP